MYFNFFELIKSQTSKFVFSHFEREFFDLIKQREACILFQFRDIIKIEYKSVP